MNINIPTIGDRIILAEDWTFKLVKGMRNYALFQKFIDEEKPAPETVTLDTGSTLEIIDIRIHSDQYNSWVGFKTNYKGDKISFWALLKDANTIDYMKA